MQTNYKFTDIKSVKVRNLLRGIAGTNDTFSVEKSMEKIKSICHGNDYKICLEIMRESPLFKKHTSSRHFNKVCPSSFDSSVSYKPNEIVKKINLNTQSITEILDVYIRSVVALGSQEYRRAAEILFTARELYGVSCFLIRALFYIRSKSPTGSSLYIEINKHLSVINIKNIDYLQHVIRELSSDKTDYFTICKKVANIDDESYLRDIAASFVDHIPRDAQEFSRRLNAYYSFSIVDAFLYLTGTHRAETPYTNSAKGIDSYLLSLFKDLSCQFVAPNAHPDNDDSTDIDLDMNFFRQTFLLIELDDYFRYKSIHGSYFRINPDSNKIRTPLERKLLSYYFDDVTCLAQIHAEKNSYKVNVSSYSSRTSCLLENSSALLYHIEKNDGDIVNDEDDFIRLMSSTRDIGTVCPDHHLRKMKNLSRSDEMRLVLASLISIRDKGQIAEHDLRRTIEKVTIEKFEGSIKDLLKDLYTSSPAVADHLLYICDEMFLSKLFHITEAPNHAIETRADILEWYGQLVDDMVLVERAKNLRIDVQINKEKGTIDDSRIYVDPVRFTQWINDNIANNMAILLDEIAEDKMLSLVTIDWSKVTSGLSVFDQVGALLLDAYREFCTNKYFGIASYLGRRIRHGTIKGTGFKEVKEIEKSEEFGNLKSTPGFLENYNSWIKNYELAFDQLIDKSLHIKGKTKPEGLITYEINSPSRRVMANYMLQEVCNSYIRNKSNIEIPYIITDYCWRLVEEDLAAIRKHIMEIKSKHAVFKVASDLKSREAQSISQDINALAADKFRTICAWFTKPSIASPSADIVLLFKAVISEIKSFFNDYSPEVKAQDEDLVISGGAYFVIYDALYILIYNAARYGKSDGFLNLDLKHVADKKDRRINISLASELAEGESEHNIIYRIEQALLSDFENAHVIEGRSGIKKLKRMEHDGCINNVTYNVSQRKVEASFDFILDF